MFIGLLSMFFTKTSLGGVITLTTPRQLGPYTFTLLSKYGYSVDNSKSIKFKVKACNDAHVGLMKEDINSKVLYHIVIGGWSNTRTVIRIRKDKPFVTYYNAVLLSCFKYVAFEVGWKSGKVELWTTILGTWTKILSYSHTDTGLVKYVGVTTASYADGYWTIFTNDVTITTTPRMNCHIRQNIFAKTHSLMPLKFRSFEFNSPVKSFEGSIFLLQKKNEYIIIATDVMTTTAMMKLVQELTTFTEEIQASPTRPDVMTTTAMIESAQERTTFSDEIQVTSTRQAPFVVTTMKVLHESTESEYMSSTKKELSTLIDVPPFASSTPSAQSMSSMYPTSCGEALNTTSKPHCYMACSKNHTEQELVEMVDKLKQELRTDKKKTSMYMRSKTSASDERKSSAAIGCVGVAILCAVGIGILLLDLPHLVQFIKHIKVNKKVTPAVKA